MGEPRRPDPVPRWAEHVRAAGRAVPGLAALSLRVGLGRGVLAIRALEVELAIAPSVDSVLEQWREESPGFPLPAIDPDTFSGRVLGERDRQTLTRGIAVLGSKASRVLPVEDMEGDYVSGEGVAGQNPLVEKAVEEVSEVGLAVV